MADPRRTGSGAIFSYRMKEKHLEKVYKALILRVWITLKGEGKFLGFLPHVLIKDTAGGEKTGAAPPSSNQRRRADPHALLHACSSAWDTDHHTNHKLALMRLKQLKHEGSLLNLIPCWPRT